MQPSYGIKPGGDLSSPVRQRKLLALMSVAEVWGVGGRTAKELEMLSPAYPPRIKDYTTAIIR